ncbi:MAG: c-type cytochrome domain-containing protein [Planctomycetaceae bacterium]
MPNNLGSHFCLAVVFIAIEASVDSSYESEVRPLLKVHCYQCHGEEQELAGGRPAAAALMRRGGDSGPAIAPGDAAGSLLLQRVTAGEMPPGNDRRLLRAGDFRLRDWIAAGASTNEPEPPRDLARPASRSSPVLTALTGRFNHCCGPHRRRSSR